MHQFQQYVDMQSTGNKYAESTAVVRSAQALYLSRAESEAYSTGKVYCKPPTETTLQAALAFFD
jgi:hypothetical protein